MKVYTSNLIVICACNNEAHPTHTLLLGPSFTALEVEVADHVVDDTLAPLKGNDDGIVLVSPLELIWPHQHSNLLLVQDFNWVGRRLQPPYRGSIFLLVNEPWKKLKYTVTISRGWWCRKRLVAKVLSQVGLASFPGQISGLGMW